MRLFILLFTLIASIQVESKIRILTFHYNLPELLEIQHKTLQKYVSDDYELIVFNDARDPAIERRIQEVCNKYGILCVRFEPEWHLTDPFNAKMSEWEDQKCYSHSHIGTLNPNHRSIRHCHVIQYALDHFGYDHDDLVVLLDGDCFPIRPLNLRAILGNKDIAGIEKEEGGINYLWVVFSIFDPKKTTKDLNFYVAIINNEIHDTGSYTYTYLKNHPEIKSRKFHGENSSGFYNWTDRELRRYGFNSNEISLIRDLDSLKGFPWPITVEFHVNNQLIHLGNSSSEHLPGAEKKRECIEKFLNLTTQGN